MQHLIDGPARMHQTIEHDMRRWMERYGETAAQITFTAPVHSDIDGEHERLVPGGERPLHHLVGQSALHDVKLKPMLTVNLARHFLNADARSRGQGERDPGLRRSPGEDELSFRPSCPIKPD